MSQRASSTKRPATKSSTARRATQPAPRRGGGSYLWGGLVAVLVIAGIVAVVVSRGESGGKAAANEVADEVTVEGGALPELPKEGDDPAIGMRAPTLIGTSPTGEAVEVAFDGTPTVVAFLAHWCPHCQAEVPRIVDLAESGAAEGVDVVAVTTGTSDQQPNYPPSAWLEDEGWPFPVLADTATATAANAYGLTGFPFLVWIGGDGEVLGRTSGELGEDQLAANLAALRAGEPIPDAAGGPSSAR